MSCTCYLNTDLDVLSLDNLTSLAAAFEAGGASPLVVYEPESEPASEDDPWQAHFEWDEPGRDEQHTEPEEAIDAMLSIVESLPDDLRRVWDGCTERNFDIGCKCGSEPSTFQRMLSNQLLGRIAAAGASVRITLKACRATH